jgi:peptide chain release factor 1
VREGGGRRRVGDVVGRHVDGLHRGDRAALGRSDALLQRAHLGAQRGLVADRAGHAPEQRGDLAAGLHEAEDVVDEQQHVLAHLVAEVLGHGHAGQPDAQPRPGRLVHLAEDHHRLGDDARLRHLEVEVVALTRALADAGEHRVAAVLGGDVADQLLDQHGLAHAGAAEQADLAAAHVRGEQVHDLDAGLELLGRGLLVLERGRGAVDRVALAGLDLRPAVDGLAEQVEEPAQALLAHRHRDRLAGVHGLHAAHQPLGRAHGDAADLVVADVQRRLDRQADAPLGVLDLDGVQDSRQLVRIEGHVHGGPDDLHDSTDVHRLSFAGRAERVPPVCYRSASAPPTMSRISRVIMS